MNNQKIIKSISIKNNTICINDQVVFSSEDDTFAAFAKAAYKNYEINYSKFYKMSHLCKLGFLASDLLLKDLDYSEFAPEDISVIISNSSSSLHTDTEYQETIESIPSPSVFVYTLPNIVIGEICIRNNFKGEGVFFIQKQYDENFMTEYVNTMFNSGKAKMCLFGWVEIDAQENYEAILHLVK